MYMLSQAQVVFHILQTLCKQHRTEIKSLSTILEFLSCILAKMSGHKHSFADWAIGTI